MTWAGVRGDGPRPCYSAERPRPDDAVRSAEPRAALGNGRCDRPDGAGSHLGFSRLRSSRCPVSASGGTGGGGGPAGSPAVFMLLCCCYRRLRLRRDPLPGVGAGARGGRGRRGNNSGRGRRGRWGAWGCCVPSLLPSRVLRSLAGRQSASRVDDGEGVGWQVLQHLAKVGTEVSGRRAFPGLLPLPPGWRRAPGSPGSPGPRVPGTARRPRGPGFCSSAAPLCEGPGPRRAAAPEEAGVGGLHLRLRGPWLGRAGERTACPASSRQAAALSALFSSGSPGVC